MFKKLAVVVSALLTAAYAAPAASPTAAAAAATASQIRTDQDPVYHLYLQSVSKYLTLHPPYPQI